MPNKIMKKISVVLLACAILFSNASFAFAKGLPVIEENTNKSIYICETKTQSIIYKANEETKRYPASLTKVLTAIVVFDNVKDLTKEVKVSDEIKTIPLDSSIADLKVDEKLSYTDLLYSLLMVSGNDSAMVLAKNVGKIIDPNAKSDEAAIGAFMSEMNKTAKKLGAKNSNFVNPHGYQDENHYTTATDLYLITKHALENDLFKTIVAAKTYTVKTNLSTHKWSSTNVLILKTIKKGEEKVDNPNFSKYADGVKTGYTSKAGACLIFSSDDNDIDVLGIVMNADKKDVYPVSKDYLSYSNEELKKERVSIKSEITEKLTLLNNAFYSERELRLIPKETKDVYVSKEDGYKLEFLYNNDYLKKDSDGYSLEKNIDKGTKLGKMAVYSNGVEVTTFDVYARNSVKKATKYDLVLNILVVLLLVALLVLLIYFIINLRSKRIRKKR